VSDETPEVQRKIIVTFKRKVNIEALGGPKYESAELFMAVEDYVDLTAEPADVISTARDLASTVKATVLDEMGLEWEATEDGIVVERLRNAFGPGVQVVPAGAGVVSSAPVAAPAPPVAGPDAPPWAGEKLDFKYDKAKLAEQREWASARFVALGTGWESEFYDNRESKKTDRHPDFRHKTHGVSIYVSDVEKAGGKDLLAA